MYVLPYILNTHNYKLENTWTTFALHDYYAVVSSNQLHLAYICISVKCRAGPEILKRGSRLLFAVLPKFAWNNKKIPHKLGFSHPKTPP